MKKIVVKRIDGGVSIIVPADNVSSDLLLRDILAVEGYVSHREIDDSALPSDRILRNAWTDNNPTSTVDICPIKSKDIIRAKRNKALEALDLVAIKESRKTKGSKLDAINTSAQSLRDLTKDARFVSNNIDDLKSLIIDIDSILNEHK